MNFSDFKRSLSKSNPPAGLLSALTALWWAGRDDWTRAHGIVMDGPDRDCDWVHAYLHRVEGDQVNAQYWYRQAGRSRRARCPGNGQPSSATSLAGATNINHKSDAYDALVLARSGRC